MLKIHDLSHAFGKLQAITDFNLQIQASEIKGIIGPNGAGKTTIFNLLCGIYRYQQGQIHLNNNNLAGLASDKIARLGMARTFQNIRLFKQLSVLDNVRCVIQHHYSLSAALISNQSFRQAEKMINEQALALLALFNLTAFANKRAGDLPYGLQRRLEIVRALATKPKVLLLDEPTCGMNPHETAEMHELILTLKNQHQLAILLIDHQMPFIMGLCPNITVLNFGKIIAQGSPADIRNHPEVIRSYLGEEC